MRVSDDLTADLSHGARREFDVPTWVPDLQTLRALNAVSAHLALYGAVCRPVEPLMYSTGTDCTAEA